MVQAATEEQTELGVAVLDILSCLVTKFDTISTELSHYGEVHTRLIDISAIYIACMRPTISGNSAL